MDDCLVCRIVRREEPVSLIYEDADIVVFPMMFPLTRGHTIVAPKRHFADIFEADPQSLAKVMTAAQSVARRMKSVLGVSAVNLITNNGKLAGQDVFHFHLHVIPRRKGDRLNLEDWWLSKVRAVKTKELKELATKLMMRSVE